MASSYSRRHEDQRAIRDTDQAEFAAVRFGGAALDAGRYDERISGADDDLDYEDPQNPGPAWQKSDVQDDTAVGDIHVEANRRLKLLGDDYPFVVQGNNMRHRPSRSGYYEFCLATCMAPTITARPFVLMPRTFERVSALLVQSYLGPYSGRLHVGSPRSRIVGKQFTAAMNVLHRHTGEWQWNPHSGLPPVLTNAGDEGVDFVAWKHPLDNRGGHLFVIAQCACGDDWTSKFNDVSLSKLGKWFHPISWVNPVRAFATPFIVSDGHMHNALREAGMVFDRVRLTKLAEKLVDDRQYRHWSRLVGRLARHVMPSP